MAPFRPKASYSFKCSRKSTYEEVVRLGSSRCTCQQEAAEHWQCSLLEEPRLKTNLGQPWFHSTA
jgi:hypothetical protein